MLVYCDELKYCLYRLAFLRGGVSLPFPLSSFERSFSFASKILFAVPILKKKGRSHQHLVKQDITQKSLTVS